MTEADASSIDRRLLETIDEAFTQHAGADARIDVAELKRALGMRSDYLAGRVLAAFDRNHDGSIDASEFREGVRKLVFGSDHDKLLFAFRVHDHDGDGTISEEELLRMITISLGENEVMRATQPPEQLTRVLFWEADTNRDGAISFDELFALLRKRPALLEKMTRSEAMWIVPNEELLAWLDARKAREGRALSPYGLLPAFFVVAWVLANGALFVHAMLSIRTPGADLAAQLGRALARCADLNGALILVPMMRRLLTRVRASVLGKVIPIDEAIDFHRVLGHTLFGLSVAHAGAFVVAYGRGHPSESLLGVFAHLRGATGLALLAVFSVMWLFALALVRRSSRFELFYFTHLLYVVWFVLAIVHAPSFAFWAGVPLLGFAVEQVWRFFRRTPEVPVIAAEALRSGVTRLEIGKPPGFDFSPGDYVFLRIPAIAKHEWHPFTLSGAPERDALQVHARSLGNWTAALRRLAEAGTGGLTASVDGPYGSPSAHIFAAKNAVLIGAGIGVTPFASVLDSILLRTTGESRRPSALQKVHFFWVNRDHYSFEWFRDLLSRIEAEDKAGLLDVHLCMDGRGAGSTALGVELARELMRSKGRSDLLTGLHTHTHVGPPDWEGMLGEVAAWHPKERVDVFFCGPPGLASKIRRICGRLGMHFREERF